MTAGHRPRVVLSVAGTDPLSGAGIVADALAIASLGAHPLTVPTALVEQDSHGVRGFRVVERGAFRAMLDAALADGRPDAIKVGMVGDESIAAELIAALERADVRVPLVVDPVLRGGTPDGGHLVDGSIVRSLEALASRITVLTPNAEEAAALLGLAAPTSPEGLESLARSLHARLGCAVLVKGGHVEPPGTDVWFDGRASRVFPPQPGPWPDVHGTGCHLSSAIAVWLASGRSPVSAVARARAWLADAVARRVVGIGTGRPQIVLASTGEA